jgi:TolB-like protein/Tfp pilus assembly protein PilF/class 3 adenylate cyclase
MPEEPASDLKFEIGHVLLMDIVAYSKLLLDEQREQLRLLNEVVRGSGQFRVSDAAGKLVRLPTGDGMALIFRDSVEAPVRCALQVSETLKSHPEIQVRMGIHSGPVSEVTHIDERTNIAGAGINIAQRVMDCGDAGHVLLSKHVAEDLEHYARWRPLLHDLGECEVKHGARISVVNLYTENAGNSHPPAKFSTQNLRAGQLAAPSRVPIFRRPVLFTLIATSVVILAIGTFFFYRATASRRSTATTQAARPGTSDSEKSIAVLPFVDLSQAKDQEYFCDGISEEILDELAKVEGLRVVARTSSFSFKGKNADMAEIAQKLNVQNVLEGSLRREGNRIRISAQLVSAANGSNLWSETYERELQGVFAVQDEITRAIVAALRIKLAVGLPARPQPNTESHDLYLKGRFYWNRRTTDAIKKSIDYFNRAIENDPNYALAYTGLADCYSSLGFNFDAGLLPSREAIPKAKAAALKALEIDDGLAEAHTSLAFIKLNYDWDWSGAEKEFKRAIELNPNHDNAHHWYSHYLTAMGRTEESLVESKRALDLDPVGLVNNVHLGWHYIYARQYYQAIEQLQKTVEMDPNRGFTHWYLGMAYEQKGNYLQAIGELQKGKDLLPENVGVEADLAHAYAVSGKREAARMVIDELKELSTRPYVSSYQIALIYTGLGEQDQAFEWLEKAYEERSDLLVYLKVEPRLDSLRSDPRFADPASSNWSVKFARSYFVAC